MSTRQIALRPIDLRVALQLLQEPPGWEYAELAARMGIASSTLHKAVQRAGRCGLLHGRRAIRSAIAECLRYGARYAFPGQFASTIAEHVPLTT